MIKDITKKIFKIVKNPNLVVVYFGSRGHFRWIPDETYVSILHKARMNEKLNLDKPSSYNEKLQWLKLYDRRPCYKNMTDKYQVRKFIASKIGANYLIPLLGMWEKFEDIDFSMLPESFVLKCTHDSGSTVICKNGEGINYKKLRKHFSKKLKFDYYYGSREWNYHDIHPRIIAEKYMVDESGSELKDYKIFTFGGKARLIQVDYGRFTNHMRNFYTTEWQYLNVTCKVPTDPMHKISKPRKLDEMIRLAEILSEGIPHVRVDFYIINDNIYFGELTFHHSGGQETFLPKSFENEMGSWISTTDNPNVTCDFKI